MKTSSSAPQSYNLTIYPEHECYDSEELNCMFQQVLAIYMGWADQIIPLEVEYIQKTYVWQTGDV